MYLCVCLKIQEQSDDRCFFKKNGGYPNRSFVKREINITFV